MEQPFLQLLQTQALPIAFVVLFLGSIIEYVFPPFPGDTVTLFGTFLAATRGYSAPAVFATITIASTLGGLLPWSLGRYLDAHPDRWPAVLRGPRVLRALDEVSRGFERRGRWYLAGNRFIPAFRAFILLGAGLGGIPLGAVLLYGGLSALLWNALLFAVGFTVGSNWEKLQSITSSYSRAALAVAIATGFAYWLRRRWARGV